jgi:hypothetical protein
MGVWDMKHVSCEWLTLKDELKEIDEVMLALLWYERSGLFLISSL